MAINWPPIRSRLLYRQAKEGARGRRGLNIWLTRNVIYPRVCETVALPHLMGVHGWFVRGHSTRRPATTCWARKFIIDDISQ